MWVFMTSNNGRMNISLDPEIAMQLKDSAFKKYGNLRSTSRFIEDMFKEIDNKPDINVIEQPPVSEAETDYTSPTPEEIEEAERYKKGNCADGSCNPWNGPWICTYCNAYWLLREASKKPKYCPICGKQNGIVRSTSPEAKDLETKLLRR
jgi:rubrerythrin